MKIASLLTSILMISFCLHVLADEQTSEDYDPCNGKDISKCGPSAKGENFGGSAVSKEKKKINPGGVKPLPCTGAGMKSGECGFALGCALSKSLGLFDCGQAPNPLETPAPPKVPESPSEPLPPDVPIPLDNPNPNPEFTESLGGGSNESCGNSAKACLSPNLKGEGQNGEDKKEQ